MGPPTTLCLCMIVKNESHIILETLNSVKKYLDYWVICDTGSTDNTVKLVQDFFAKENIPGEMFSDPWVDFGHNRSMAFERAQGKADYLLVMDADDILVGDLCLDELDADTYTLRYGDDFTYWRDQIFKASEKWAYKGVLHEYPVCLSKPDASKKKLMGRYHMASRRLGARSAVDPVVKYLNDAQTLQAALASAHDPALTARYLFYIAQSYRDANEPELAMAWYRKRVEAGGWAEEVWFSLYESGRLNQSLNRLQAAQTLYLEAFEFRPSRAESLYSLGQSCNLQRKFEQAALYLTHAEKIPYTPDSLFVSKGVYDYAICFELSISCYWVGDFARCITLCDKLLAMQGQIPSPIYEQTLLNRAFAVSKLGCYPS